MNAKTKTENRSKELDEASYFFRFFAEKIESVFWVRDKTGTKQLYLSPSYEKVWGRSLKSLYDNPCAWIETLMPEDRALNAMSQRMEDDCEEYQDKKYENRYRIIRPDGETRWIKDINFPIFNDSNKFIGFAGIANDITDDVLREKELIEAKEHAEKANRAKSDFLAMMSHELRTPLNAILGMAQILMNSGLTEEQSNHVEVITHSGQNLLAIISDLLDFAKIEAGELSFKDEPLALKQFVTNLITNMKSQANAKNLQLKLNYNITRNELVICDPKRLRQILINLLSNAIKFTDSGHVALTVSQVQQTKSQQVICFTVEDTGIGIDKSKVQTIFDRFQQIDSVYQRKHDGVGLGLAIVKELVEKMGGSVMLTSEPGVGSQFSCILSFKLAHYKSNLANSLSVPSSDKNSTQKSFKKYNMKILVVEDNVINQKISKIMLEQLGCVIDIAESASSALNKINNHYDLIFMDICLPDHDGFYIVKQMRRHDSTKEVPIVAMTAHVFEQDKDRCYEVGMNDVIAKPIAHTKLVEILERWAP